MRKFEFDYDYENDNLIVFKKGRKSSGSVEIGNMNFDFYKGELIAIEFDNASKYLGLTKKALNRIIKSNFEVMEKNNWLIVKFFILTVETKLEKEIYVQNVTQPSPALALA